MIALQGTDTLHTLKTEHLSADEALNICDSLEAVSVGFMQGRWKGSEVRTGHPYVGALEATGWYGKLFIDPDNVHPLVFYKNDRELFSVNPGRLGPWLGIRVDYTKTPILKPIMQLARPLIQTHQGKARLRMTMYRGVVSATMIYDQLPVHDVFRKLNDNAVLGIMDRRGDALPYFFVLERDDDSALTLNL